MKQLLTATGVIALGVTIVLGQGKRQIASSPGPSSLEDVRQAINKGNAQWCEGWAKGDAAMVAAVFAEDGVQLAASGKIIKGRQQIMERQNTAMRGADPGVKVTISTVNIWLDGDTAYETGKYTYEYTEQNKPGKDEGRYVTVWKHQKDNSWRLSMDMGIPQE